MLEMLASTGLLFFSLSGLSLLLHCTSRTHGVATFALSEPLGTKWDKPGTFKNFKNQICLKDQNELKTVL